RGFRDRTVAAPLKLVRGNVDRVEGGGSFRDRTVAAPLKHDRLDRGRGRLQLFPRPDGRGPIEAPCWPCAAVYTRGFRDRTVAAPLKRARQVAQPALALLRFRDRTVAAPLKPESVLPGAPPPPGFRDRTVAAALKGAGPPSRLHRSSGFR